MGFVNINWPFALSLSKGIILGKLWFDRLTTNGLGKFALVAQREPLLHAKLVLLVHDRQAKFMKADLLLKQRVRANSQQRFAAGDAFGGELLLLFLQTAG